MYFCTCRDVTQRQVMSDKGNEELASSLLKNVQEEPTDEEHYFKTVTLEVTLSVNLCW